MSELGWVAETIKTKSDQLNAVDLVAGPITVTVVGVRQAKEPDQPVVIDIGPKYQPFKPCKTCRRILVACWGLQSWVGRSMTLYNDPNVKWAGKEVGGIRISHLSHIDVEKSVQVNVSKSQKETLLIKPLGKKEASIEDRIAKVVAAIGRAKDGAELDKVLELAKPLYAILDDTQRQVIDKAKSAWS